MRLADLPPDFDEEIDAAFMTAYRILRKRIEHFFSLPLDEIKHDCDRMKAALDRIGEDKL